MCKCMQTLWKQQTDTTVLKYVFEAQVDIEMAPSVDSMLDVVLVLIRAVFFGKGWWGQGSGFAVGWSWPVVSRFFFLPPHRQSRAVCWQQAVWLSVSPLCWVSLWACQRILKEPLSSLRSFKHWCHRISGTAACCSFGSPNNNNNKEYVTLITWHCRDKLEEMGNLRVRVHGWRFNRFLFFFF